MSKRSIKKSIKKSFAKSAEYSVTLAFGLLFLISSMYGIPNLSVVGQSSNTSESKNLKTTNNAKLDSSYKRYCNSDDHEGICNYVAINDDALVSAPIISISYKIYLNKIYDFNQQTSQSIRAPPVTV